MFPVFESTQAYAQLRGQRALKRLNFTWCFISNSASDWVLFWQGCESTLMALNTKWQKGFRTDPFRHLDFLENQRNPAKKRGKIARLSVKVSVATEAAGQSWKIPTQSGRTLLMICPVIGVRSGVKSLESLPTAPLKSKVRYRMTIRLANLL